MTLLLIGALVGVGIWIGWRLAYAADQREEQLEREWRERQAQHAAEVEDVPLDWLDELDDIRRLPETAT